MPFAVSDAISSVLSTALDGVDMRQRVAADNIANIDTPGFRATSVDFESSLRAAITGGDFTEAVERDRAMPAVDVTLAATRTPAGENGNNVDLRKESLSAMQSQFQYQLLTRAVTDRMALVRTAAVGQ